MSDQRGMEIHPEATLLTALPYCVVLVVGPAALTFGVAVVGLAVARLLSGASVVTRTNVTGLCAGIGGVLLPVALGPLIFGWLAGPGSFKLLPFFATILPLLVLIARDFRKAWQLADARTEFLRSAMRTDGPFDFDAAFEETLTTHGPTVLGELVGLLMALLTWFLTLA